MSCFNISTRFFSHTIFSNFNLRWEMRSLTRQTDSNSYLIDRYSRIISIKTCHLQIQREIVLAEQLFNEREALSVRDCSIIYNKPIQLARQRNSVVWELFTTGTVTIAALYYGIKTKNKFAMVPIIPLVMVSSLFQIGAI